MNYVSFREKNDFCFLEIKIMFLSEKERESYQKKRIIIYLFIYFNNGSFWAILKLVKIFPLIFYFVGSDVESIHLGTQTQL